MAFGEESTETPIETPEIGAIALINSPDINQMFATAKRFPRSIAKFRKEAYDLITLDEETAAQCIYALPRGKERNPETGRTETKIIKGPSARFAEVIAYAWGNCRFGARAIGEDQSFTMSQGMFFDLEKNVAVSFEVKRRITNRDGDRYNDDMIGTTSNAASSIALRNAVLKGIPKAIWKGLYLAAEKTLMGDIKTLNDRRQAMIELFKPFAVTPQGICQLLEVQGVSEIQGEQLLTLQGMLTALREGDTTVEALFAAHSQPDQKAADRAQRTVADIKSQYQQQPAQTGSQPANPQQPQQQQINLDAEPSETETAAAHEKGQQTEPQPGKPQGATRSQTSTRSGASRRSGGSGKDDF